MDWPKLPDKYAYLKVGDTMAVVDVDIYNEVKQYRWRLVDGYPFSCFGGKHVFLHRYVNKTPEGMVTDHINRCRLDNRRCNLETVTASENGKRRKVNGKRIDMYDVVPPARPKLRGHDYDVVIPSCYY